MKQERPFLQWVHERVVTATESYWLDKVAGFKYYTCDVLTIFAAF